MLKNYGDAQIKIGESDSGRKLKATFKTYLQYLIYNQDDSPLYLFESSPEDNKGACSIMKDYKVPKFFKANLFEVVSWYMSDKESSKRETCLHTDGGLLDHDDQELSFTRIRLVHLPGTHHWQAIKDG